MHSREPLSRLSDRITSGMQGAESHWIRFLHLAALAGLGLAQPFYDLLSKAPEFLVAHRSEPGDILLLVLLASLLVPVAGIGLEWVVGLVSRPLATYLHILLMALLVATLVLSAIRNSERMSSLVMFLLALAAGTLGGIAYSRSTNLRSFVTLLSTTALVFPVWFLLRPPISNLVFEPSQEVGVSARSQSKTPVVLIIFDDLPLSSLLNKADQINSSLYPSFARLADTADWFINATTVTEGTSLAVPAILTGRYPRQRVSDSAAQNLFSLLEASHRLEAFEQSFSNCPEELCEDPLTRLAGTERVRLLLSDVVVIYQHLLSPASIQATLPPIDLAWSGFRSSKQSGPRATDTVALMERFIQSIDRSRQPALHYLHPNFPHMPWKLLPSGREYGPLSLPYRPFGLGKSTWSSEEHFATQGWQRHLLQVGYADRVLGRVLDKLESEDIFEDALIIVSSDHGSSYLPGEHVRGGALFGPNAADVLRVPLLVKRPGQAEGRARKEAVETIDILPTITDLLDVTPAWTMDGRSLLGRVVERDAATAFDSRTMKQVTYSSESLQIAETVNRKLAIFGDDPSGLFAFGPLKNLVGRATSEFEVRSAHGLTALIEGEAEYKQVERNSNFVPAFIVGRILQERELVSGTSLAIAVNGTIRAGAQLTQTSANEGRFAALVPEESFKDGGNEIDIFLVEQPASATNTTLIRIDRPGHEIFYLDGEEIRSSSGEIWTIGRSGLRGAVEQVNWELVGWAANLRTLVPAERIVMFVDGEFTLTAPVREKNPGGERRYGKPLAHSAFRFMIPFSKIPQDASVRLFAVEGESAVELRYGDSFRLTPPQKQPN